MQAEDMKQNSPYQYLDFFTPALHGMQAENIKQNSPYQYLDFFTPALHGMQAEDIKQNSPYQYLDFVYSCSSVQRVVQVEPKALWIPLGYRCIVC